MTKAMPFFKSDTILSYGLLTGTRSFVYELVKTEFMS